MHEHKMTLSFILLTGLFLAFSNGANDNFKGVATLLGSETASYKVALVWATVTTLAGSLTAFFLAQKLMSNFSGKGLVPEQIVGLPEFSVAVVFAAAITVFLASRYSFPISTTHALTGALVGAGWFASPEGVNTTKLYSTFFLPLILSPFIAILGTIIIYPIFSLLRKNLDIRRESCICLGKEILAISPTGIDKGTISGAFQIDCCPQLSIGTKVTCEERYVGNFLGIEAQTILDGIHFLSSGLVSFARGLNDTPKIAALLMVGSTISPMMGIAIVAISMAVGGVIYSRRIAETMSYQITKMNDGQGFSANLVTSLVVMSASKLGVPVSTTHVSCGSLFGIGIVTKQAQWKSILKIFLAWITTLPVSALLGLIIYNLIKGVI